MKRIGPYAKVGDKWIREPKRSAPVFPDPRPLRTRFVPISITSATGGVVTDIQRDTIEIHEKEETPHFISDTCLGEKCIVCGEPATHKIAEVVPSDHPKPWRKSLSAYMCCKDFGKIFGTEVVYQWCGCQV